MPPINNTTIVKGPNASISPLKTIFLEQYTDLLETIGFKKANSLLKEGKSEMGNKQAQSGIKKIEEGLALLKEIIETNYKIKMLPFNSQEQAKAIALLDSTKDSAHKLTERYEQIIKESQADKITISPSPETTLSKYTPHQAARMLFEVFGKEGLQNSEYADDREKAFKLLGIILETEKTQVIKLGLELAILQSRYEEDCSPIDDLTLKTVYGINDPAATYDGKSIDQAVQALRSKLIKGDEMPASDPSRAVFEAAGKLSENGATSPSLPPSSPLPPLPPLPSHTPPVPNGHKEPLEQIDRSPTPPANIVPLFLAEIKSFKPKDVSPKGIEISKLTGSDISRETDAIKFIQALAKEGIISLDEEYAALLKVAESHSIANQIAELHFDVLGDNIELAIFGQELSGDQYTSNSAEKLYQYLKYFLESNKKKNAFIDWDINETKKQLIVIPKFNSAKRSPSVSDVRKYQESATKDFEEVENLIDKAHLDGVIGPQTKEFLKLLLSDPNANPDLTDVTSKRQSSFPAEVKKIALIINATYGGLFNKVRNYVLDTNQQRGGVLPSPSEGIVNIATATKVKPENIQKFLLKRGIISESKPLPLPKKDDKVSAPPALTLLVSSPPLPSNVEKVYSVLVAKGGSASNFEKLCRDAGIPGNNGELRELAEEIIIGSEGPVTAEPAFKELTDLANAYYDATEPAKQSDPVTPTEEKRKIEVVDKATISVVTSVKSPFITELAKELGMNLENGSLPTREELQSQFRLIISSIKDGAKRKQLTEKMLQLGKEIPFTAEHADGTVLDVSNPSRYDECVLSVLGANTEANK